jgi:sugar (pentulose or hexulose) kinase
MPIILGVDLGTTKITVVAVDTHSGDVVATCTAANQAETTATDDKLRGYSEWDARTIAAQALKCVCGAVEQLGERRRDIAGLGITGQQHGVVLVDDRLAPLTPLINWQDRRADEPITATGKTYVQRAVEMAGPQARDRTGCTLAAGYMGTTLYWMKERQALPEQATACFVMDYFAALLTGKSPVTDPTCAGSSGLLNVVTNTWDGDLLTVLGLQTNLFPPVRPSGERLGALTPERAAAIGLSAGTPVFVGIGDNQASFVGSVGDPAHAVAVNVGTGGQVAAFAESFANDAALETRPFPRGGFLLVAAGLAGGASYAVLERFFKHVGVQLFGVKSEAPLFPRLNELAASVPAGGLHCEPYFNGTRADPDLRASWTGVTAENFTPAYLTRALLEAMARTFEGGYQALKKHLRSRPTRLVGAGNGLRENALLARLVAEALDLPLSFARHREEAAFGAALVAAVGAGIFPNLAAAGRIIKHQAG